MRTITGYIFERKILNAKTRFYTTNKDKVTGKLLEIVTTTLDDNGNVIERRYEEVKDEQK